MATNAQIILSNAIDLMEAGVLKPGEPCTIIDEDGNEREGFLPEEIHTYAAWKELGYQVRKGEHAKASFPIWKPIKEKGTAKGRDLKTKEVIEYETESRRMIMVRAHFFTRDQVEPIAA